MTFGDVVKEVGMSLLASFSEAFISDAYRYAGSLFYCKGIYESKHSLFFSWWSFLT